MLKEVIDSLKEQKKKVEKEIDKHEAFSIKTTIENERLNGVISRNRDVKYTKIGIPEEKKENEMHILGHPISKKSPVTMMGKKIIKQ